MFKEYEEISAYAKIQSDNLLEFITKPTAYLGREGTCIDHRPNEQVIAISDSNKISRKHLKLYWSEKDTVWKAMNLSKNQVVINKKYLKRDDPAVLLSPISAIQIDSLKFYFFQAREVNDNHNINFTNGVKQDSDIMEVEDKN